MKNRMLQIIVTVLLVAAPATAQDFRSTSTMQGSGSQYSPQVSPVGSVQPSPVQSSTGSLPMPISSRRQVENEGISGDFDKPGYDTSDESPVGDAWVMLAFAAAACGIVFLRRRKVQKAENK